MVVEGYDVPGCRAGLVGSGDHGRGSLPAVAVLVAAALDGVNHGPGPAW